MAMQEERFSLGEKSDRMVTLTPFMGKLKVHIGQFYANERGEKKPGKSGIALEIQEFNKLVKLIPKVQDCIARYKLRDTGISSSPFELDLPVLDLDPLFLPSHHRKNLFHSLKTKNFCSVNPNVLHRHHLLFSPM